MMALNRCFLAAKFNFLNRVAQNLTRSMHREEPVMVYGLNINTIQYGKGPRGLLLLPGSLGTALTDFPRQLEELPCLLPDHKVVAWDPPGHGKSMPHLKPCPDMFVQDANAAIDLMNVLKVGFFSVLGWDAGGITALVMAGRFPQFIDRVVVFGTNAYFSSDELKRLDAARGALTKDGSHNMNSDLEAIYGATLYTEKWRTYVDSLNRIMKAKEGDICKTEVDCVQAPTLILHGTNDHIISREHPEYLHQHIKNSQYYEITDGGHDIHITNDKQFNKTVARFLSQKNP